MKPNGLVPRIVALFLIFSLTLSGSASALRQVGLEESDETRREVVAQLTSQPVPLTTQDPRSAITFPAVGLEEGISPQQAKEKLRQWLEGKEEGPVGVMLRAFPEHPDTLISRPTPQELQTAVEKLLNALLEDSRLQWEDQHPEVNAWAQLTLLSSMPRSQETVQFLNAIRDLIEGESSARLEEVKQLVIGVEGRVAWILSRPHITTLSDLQELTKEWQRLIDWPWQDAVAYEGLSQEALTATRAAFLHRILAEDSGIPESVRREAQADSAVRNAKDQIHGLEPITKDTSIQSGDYIFFLQPLSAHNLGSGALLVVHSHRSDTGAVGTGLMASSWGSPAAMDDSDVSRTPRLSAQELHEAGAYRLIRSTQAGEEEGGWRTIKVEVESPEQSQALGLGRLKQHLERIDTLRQAIQSRGGEKTLFGAGFFGSLGEAARKLRDTLEDALRSDPVQVSLLPDDAGNLGSARGRYMRSYLLMPRDLKVAEAPLVITHEIWHGAMQDLGPGQKRTHVLEEEVPHRAEFRLGNRYLDVVSTLREQVSSIGETTPIGQRLLAYADELEMAVFVCRDLAISCYPHVMVLQMHGETPHTYLQEAVRALDEIREPHIDQSFKTALGESLHGKTQLDEGTQSSLDALMMETLLTPALQEIEAAKAAGPQNEEELQLVLELLSVPGSSPQAGAEEGWVVKRTATMEEREVIRALLPAIQRDPFSPGSIQVRGASRPVRHLGSGGAFMVYQIGGYPNLAFKVPWEATWPLELRTPEGVWRDDEVARVHARLGQALDQEADNLRRIAQVFKGQLATVTVDGVELRGIPGFAPVAVVTRDPSKDPAESPQETLVVNQRVIGEGTRIRMFHEGGVVIQQRGDPSAVEPEAAAALIRFLAEHGIVLSSGTALGTLGVVEDSAQGRQTVVLDTNEAHVTANQLRSPAGVEESVVDRIAYPLGSNVFFLPDQVMRVLRDGSLAEAMTLPPIRSDRLPVVAVETFKKLETAFPDLARQPNPQKTEVVSRILAPGHILLSTHGARSRGLRGLIAHELAHRAIFSDQEVRQVLDNGFEEMRGDPKMAFSIAAAVQSAGYRLDTLYPDEFWSQWLYPGDRSLVSEQRWRQFRGEVRQWAKSNPAATHAIQRTKILESAVEAQVKAEFPSIRQRLLKRLASPAMRHPLFSKHASGLEQSPTAAPAQSAGLEEVREFKSVSVDEFLEKLHQEGAELSETAENAEAIARAREEGKIDIFDIPSEEILQRTSLWVLTRGEWYQVVYGAARDKALQLRMRFVVKEYDAPEEVAGIAQGLSSPAVVIRSEDWPAVPGLANIILRDPAHFAALTEAQLYAIGKHLLGRDSSILGVLSYKDARGQDRLAVFA